MKAPKIILVHNHPSGDAKPSEQDIRFTDYVYTTTNLLGVELLDHLVIGNNSYTSIFSQMLSDTKD